MAAVRQREGNEVTVSRRVRRRGIGPCPAQASSASGALSGDSDADPTQSQAASWHPSQPQPSGLTRGGDAQSLHGLHGRSQREVIAEGVAPIAASQSAAQTRLLARPGSHQLLERVLPASQRPCSAPEAQRAAASVPPRAASHGADVPLTQPTASPPPAVVEVPLDAPRRLTRARAHRASRTAQAQSGTAADDVPTQAAGEVSAAQEAGAPPPAGQPSLVLSLEPLATGSAPSSQGSGPVHSSSDSQRAGRGGSAGLSAGAGVHAGEPGRTAEARVQRITRFFSPMTATLGGHHSPQHDQTGAAAAIAADASPQGQEHIDGGGGLRGATANRRLASQHSMEVASEAAASAQPSPGSRHQMVAASGAELVGPFQFPPSFEGPPGRLLEHWIMWGSMPPSVIEPAAAGAVLLGDTATTAARRRRPASAAEEPDSVAAALPAHTGPDLQVNADTAEAQPGNVDEAWAPQAAVYIEDYDPR